MKRKLDKKKLVLEQATVTVLTTSDYAMIIGGGNSKNCCDTGNCVIGENGIALTVRRCAL
jgi:hypothetical protein